MKHSAPMATAGEVPATGAGDCNVGVAADWVAGTDVPGDGGEDRRGMLIAELVALLRTIVTPVVGGRFSSGSKFLVGFSN